MPNENPKDKPTALSPTREKIHRIIFGADTFWGLTFDICLLIAILASIVVVCLQTVEYVGWQGDDHGPTKWSDLLTQASWAFTILFTIEYALRLYCVRLSLIHI